VDETQVVGLTAYGGVFPSIILDRAFIGTQFHPELSGEVGQALLQDIFTRLS
jgi:imidazoleglycerol phosphate synthase glutamine amidotransferase subunit HisH